MSFEFYQLSDIANIQGGFAFKGADFQTAGVAVVKIANIQPPSVSLSGVDRVQPIKLLGLDRFKLRDGDVLMAMTGATVGKVGRFKHSEPAYLNQRVARITAKKGSEYDDFIYAVVTQPCFDSLIEGASVGSAQANISTTGIGSVQIPRLESDTQLVIGKVARALDDRIALLRETNATLEAIAQALFKSWFVDFDPVRAKLEGRAPEGMDEATAALFPDSFEKSELGLVPRGWRATSLAALISQAGGNIQTGPFGSQLHASDYVIEGVPVVMPKDISLRRVQTESIARIAPIDVERLARHKLIPGDIVFSRRGDVERHALISEAERGWLCGTGCLLVKPGKKWPSPTFLSMLLDAPQARTWLVQHAVGATMPNLNTSILGSVPVVQPPDDLLIAFEDVVSTLEMTRAENSARAQTLATLRDTLLPRLISGQLRLPEIVAELLESNV